jgi:hypothetical protein
MLLASSEYPQLFASQGFPTNAPLSRRSSLGSFIDIAAELEERELDALGWELLDAEAVS